MRILLLGLILSAGPAWGGLRAGAARVDITPPANAALPMSGYGGREAGFEGIWDHLFIRAVVVDDGSGQAAIAIADLVEIPDVLWNRLASRIESEFKIPRRNLLIAATHTHGGPSLGFTSGDRPSPQLAAYAQEVEDKFLQAIEEARSHLQPARFGAGSGTANVNMNRRARMANGGLWLGRNPDGPSDKTVAVVKFESLSGEPIAILLNYGVHGTVFGAKNLKLTADLPGAASVRVERHYGGKTVAIFSSGAAGDQNPIYNPKNGG